MTAEQIDNLSVIGRNPLELLRILPGIVAPPQNQLENVSFGGGANETQAYSLRQPCNRWVDHVPNGAGEFADGVCDATGGYSFAPNTGANFGRIRIKRGHRVIELAVKYYF